MANKQMIDAMWDDSPVDVSTEVNFIWSIANKLRGPYRSDKYKDVIIPMTIIRRFECALAPTKQKVVDQFKANPNFPAKAMYRISGFQFYNTSEFDLAELVNDADHIAANFKSYLQGFFRYLLHAYDISKVFYNMGNGVRQGLNFSEFSRLTVFEPPIEIQDKVTQYLDTATAEVDKIISDIQTQIDTLEQYKRSVITETVTKGLNPDAEMKDSGIQWIGDMPAHWGVIRGKYILRYMQKPVRENDGVITCFRDGEVTLRSNRREDGFTMSDKEIGYQGIDVDDLVIHGMDGFAGAIGISDSRGKASPVLNVLDTDQCKRYIMYYLRSMAYSDVFLALATGIRVRSCDLRWNKLAELSYPVPPLDEQNAIVKHIDSVLSKADAVIADKKAQLATLDEYKKSLIFEYVTGKKEVPVS